MVKDNCYKEAKEKFDVFPSAYASGHIAKCRKKSGKVKKSKKGTSLKKSLKKLNKRSKRGAGIGANVGGIGAGIGVGKSPRGKEVKKPLYKPFPSKSKTKKYDVYVKSESGGVKKISFGQKGYEHYHDKIGHYSNLDHNDKDRRKNYRSRHKNDSIKDKNTPGWWAWHKLW